MEKKFKKKERKTDPHLAWVLEDSVELKPSLGISEPSCWASFQTEQAFTITF